LTDTYPVQEIARNWPIAGPSRSPDVTSLVSFLWGHGNSNASARNVCFQESLLARIQAVSVTIFEKHKEFRRVRQNII
ncbi:hypothetical protein C0J52_27079, partial [Blattella germanica]